MTSAARAVPFRGLAVSLIAMGAAVVGALLWPDLLLEQETIAGGLAMMPALLLAHYRRWRWVSLLLGIGLIGLTLVHLSPIVTGIPIDGLFVILFAVAPYISISLSAGWLGEVRRYQAELRTTQLQLIQAEKLESLGRLAAGVAHELKNPLMMLLTGVKVLSARVPAPDEAGKQVIVDMSDAIDRADRIIGGLLNYSRADGLDTAPVALNAVVEDSLRLVAHELTRTRATLVTALDPAIPPLRLDRYKIEQVIVNVLTNAVHAAGAAGEIRVTTALEKLRRG
ncbi:MAG: sensor histidine kinase, partial [Candidatus Rokuibacteriota bacterium]